MEDQRKAVIYALCEPDGETVRYIGKTLEGRVHLRFKRHLHDHSKETSHKKNWIVSLKNVGQRPVMKILATVPREEWDYWEVFYITKHRLAGCDLTNLDGGGWGPDKWTEERLAALRVSLSSPGYLDKVSGENHFFNRRPETRANHQAALNKEEYKVQFRGENNPMNRGDARANQLAAVRTPEQRAIRKKTMTELNQREDVVANKIAALKLRAKVFKLTKGGVVRTFTGRDAAMVFLGISDPTLRAAVKRGERDGWKIECLGTVASNPD